MISIIIIMSDLVAAATDEKDTYWGKLADSLSSASGKKRKHARGTSSNTPNSPPKVQIRWNANAVEFRPTGDSAAATFFQLKTLPTHKMYIKFCYKQHIRI